jgi:hypothetical protein
MQQEEDYIQQSGKNKLFNSILSLNFSMFFIFTIVELWCNNEKFLKFFSTIERREGDAGCLLLVLILLNERLIDVLIFIEQIYSYMCVVYVVACDFFHNSWNL